MEKNTTEDVLLWHNTKEDPKDDVKEDVKEDAKTEKIIRTPSLNSKMLCDTQMPNMYRKDSTSPHSVSHHYLLAEMSERMYEMILKLDHVIEVMEKKNDAEMSEQDIKSQLYDFNMNNLLQRIRVICKSLNNVFYHGMMSTGSKVKEHTFYIVKDTNQIAQLTSSFIFPVTEYTEKPSWICDNCTLKSMTDAKWQFVCNGHVEKIILDQINDIIKYIYQKKRTTLDKIRYSLTSRQNKEKLFQIKTLLDKVNVYYHNTFSIDTNITPTIDNIHNTVFTFGAMGHNVDWFCNSLKSCSYRKDDIDFTKSKKRYKCLGHINFNVITDILAILDTA